MTVESNSLTAVPIGVSSLSFGFCNATSAALISRARFQRGGSDSHFADTEHGSTLSMGLHDCGERKCWVITDGKIELAVARDQSVVTHPPSGEWDIKCFKNDLSGMVNYIPGARLSVMEKDTFQTTIWMKPSKAVCQCQDGWKGAQCREPDSSDQGLSCGEERSLWIDPRASQFIYAGLLDFPVRIVRGLISGFALKAQANWINLVFYTVLGIVLVPLILICSIGFAIMNLFLVLGIIVLLFPVLAYLKVMDVEQAIIFCIPLPLGREFGVNVFPLVALCAAIGFFFGCKDIADSAKQAGADVREAVEKVPFKTTMANLGAVYSSFGAISAVCPAAAGAYYIKIAMWTSFGFKCIVALLEMHLSKAQLDTGSYKFVKALVDTMNCVANVLVTLGCKEIRDFTVYQICYSAYTGINGLTSAFKKPTVEAMDEEQAPLAN